MQNEFEYYDTQQTENIVCPYCGFEDLDSWERSFDDNEMDDERKIDCPSCSKEFQVVRHIRVNYSAWRNPKECEHPDQTIYCDYCGIRIPDATPPVAK